MHVHESTPDLIHNLSDWEQNNIFFSFLKQSGSMILLHTELVNTPLLLLCLSAVMLDENGWIKV
jgi:hypothetical protein